MNKKIKLLILSIVLIAISILSINIYIRNYDENHFKSKDRIKVGFFEYAPYYFTNDFDKVDGYYHDVMKYISKYSGLEYEYIKYSFEEALEKLENNEIDLLIGLSKVEEREENLIYSNKSIGVERYGIYSNSDIDYADLELMEGLSLGIIKGGTNSMYVKKLLSDRGVSINIAEYDEQPQLIDSFKSKEIDISIQPVSKDSEGNLSYTFSMGRVYIATNKKNQELMEKIDKAINQNAKSFKKYLNNSYTKHFGINENGSVVENKDFSYIILILIFIIILIFMLNHSRIKISMVKHKVRNRILNNEYLLYYQPIYNPKNDNIVGFEALLRLKDKQGNILSPAVFMKEIEDNDMLFEISLWIFERVIKDYDKLHKKYNLKNNKYISINISIDEIIQDEFINKINQIAQKYKFHKYKICLEIVERFKSKNVKELNKSVKDLKELGFLIAIDDFGIEYSNLDLLEKIDFDIIKLDRYFINNKSKSFIKEEVLKFLSELSKRANSSLVVEGVEDKEQNDFVKNIDNEKIYVQGYYYSKPTSIE